ncbi:MAG TPA: branched-chain amino acid ABC transporter permease [Paracoccaceae bacterium]|nr:branched-chain amino acid ABC transporter permease [Paracoccaceae bacterium]
MDPLVVQHLVNWLTLGSIYALVALGFSLLFGVLNVIHFSHGDVSMVAPFIVLGVISALYGSVMPADMPGLVLAVVIALVATGALGILLDRLVIRRFRDSPAMMALVATVALGTVLRELIRTLYPQGSNPKPFPRFISGHVSIGELSLSSYSLFVIIVSALAMFALFWMMRNTQLGLRIRAVSEDRSAARLMAIDPNRVFAATFFIASAVGAIGGVFFASYAGVVRFDFGIMYGLLGFSAAVIGGLGSMQGAIIGSMVIAGIDIAVQATFPEGAPYRLVFIFLLVILVLVVKPSGLLGRPVMEKV